MIKQNEEQYYGEKRKSSFDVPENNDLPENIVHIIYYVLFYDSFLKHNIKMICFISMSI